MPADLRRRLVAAHGKPAFLLADAADTASGKPILLTQQDVRELQLASGAIRAGMEILLRRGGLAPTDLDAVLIAGGFGNYVRRSNAQRIGLLPPADSAASGYATRATRRWPAPGWRPFRTGPAVRPNRLPGAREHVDLSGDPDFKWAFADAMLFPQ